MYNKNLIFWLSVVFSFVLINTACHDNNPVKSHPSHPSHPVIPSEFIIYNLEEDKCQTL